MKAKESEIAGHTPGPWICCGNHVDDSMGLPLVRDARGFDRVNGYDHWLIAAAPELLEACEGLMEAIASLPPETQYGLDRVVGKAELATAKARGLA